MSIDDHALEAIRKSAHLVNPSDKSETYLLVKQKSGEAISVTQGTTPWDVNLTNGSIDATLRTVSTQVTGSDNGLVTNAVIHGKSTAGGGSYIDVKVTPSGALTTESEISNDIGVYMADTGSVDAFQRVRTSQPISLFDGQFTYDLQPLIFEQITAETGATITYDSTNRCPTMTFSSTPTGGKAYMQSYQHMRYYPAKGQMALVTFNFVEQVANVLKFAGYSTGSNGIEFQNNGTTNRVVLYSDTSNGDQIVNQADWNLDTLDGNGPSGITLNITKTQIFIIDFQALYVGRVRVGFDIDGLVYYVHEFKHANRIANPYIQTANLPIRAGMTCTGTVSTTMCFICSSVLTEGAVTGEEGYNFSQSGSVTAANGSRTHAISLRPKATFNSIETRAKFVFESIEILAGNAPVKWELVIGQAISGTTTFNDVNTTYAFMEYNTAGTLSGSPAIVIASGFLASGAAARGTISATIKNRYPITLDASGNPRINGTLTLLLTGIGGTSACQYAMNWTGIR